MRQLHIGVAQVQSTAGDPWSNMQRMHRQIRAAAAVDVDVLLFAETVMHGYDVSPENLQCAEPFGGPLTVQLQQWAAEYALVIMAGMLERHAEHIFNTHVIAYPDGRLLRERKHCLTEMEKAAGISPGQRARTPILLHDVSCAILICADTSIEGIYDDLHRQGIEYLFIPTAGGGKREDYLRSSALATMEGLQRYCENRSKVFKAEAVLSEDDCHFPGWASANALGDDGRHAVHQGHCMIVDGQRVMRAQIPGTNVIDHFLDQMVHAIITFPDKS